MGYPVWGLIDPYEATGTRKWLDRATMLTDRQIELFYDEGTGGLYDTDGEQKHLLIRSKEFYGGTRPADNAIALTNLVDLHRITGEDRYGTLAKGAFRYVGQALQRSPAGLTQFLTALKKRLGASS